MRGDGRGADGHARRGAGAGRGTALAAALAGAALLLAGCSGAGGPGATGTAPASPADPGTTAREPGAATSVATGPPGSALALLASLQVKGRAAQTGYSREKFGETWSDTDRNGCDTRNDVLRRDLYDLRTRGRCVVTSGTLRDPYTQTTIAFVRGQGTSEAVQIDHVVALSNAWQTGAQQWPAGKRLALANDPLELLAVDGPTNQRKSDSDAASWLPPSRAYRCAYVARQVAVKAKYGLWVTRPEREAMRAVLVTCPEEPAPTGGNPTEASTG